jgi:hypothetical protein
MVHGVDVLMLRIVAVCAGRGNIDLGSRRFGASRLVRLDDHGEALAGRCRDAFGRAVAVVELLMMAAGPLGAKHVHVGDEHDGRWRNVAPGCAG